MSDIIKIKRGLDIKLKVNDFNENIQPVDMSCFAVKPTDFPGMTPRLAVKEGAQVKAGTTLFTDKNNPEVRIASPVSGVVERIVRGEKRKLLEIIVKSDGENGSEALGTLDPGQADRKAIAEWLLQNGYWPMIRQRPYAIVADPRNTPKAIVIPCFDSAPLAPAYEKILAGREAAFQTGVDALAKLTSGKVYLTLHVNQGDNTVFSQIRGVTVQRFSGPHPSGSVGVQIHHIDPINKGESVWYVNPQDVAAMGQAMQTGQFDATRIIAVNGSEVREPGYFKTKYGAQAMFVAGNLLSDHVRIVSGNILTGEKIAADGFIGYYDHQLSVLPEGDTYEFMGWLAPGFGKFSISRAFPSFLCKKHAYRLDTNLHGAHRAFVMTGQYEQVVPMDIYPVQLLKAILAGDLDKMEQLGIYEVAEEDLALCEVVCTSKIEVQRILRQGIEMMIKEM